MRKCVLIASAALIVTSASAKAADLEVERELGLIVSGVVDQWAGVQFIDGPEIGGGIFPESSTDDTVFATGLEALLSLPLGSNLSIQNDAKLEYNGNGQDSEGIGGVIGPEYFFQGAAHVSWRDPNTGLLGGFGGVGVANSSFFDSTDYRFVGGEGQFYSGPFTFYVQGGYVDFDGDSWGPLNFGATQVSASSLDDGLFVRGVVRWFPDAESRFQLEGTYLNADYESSSQDMEAFSVKARYDFTFNNIPFFGSMPLYVAYRGTFRDSCGIVSVNDNSSSFDTDDHTFMIGSSYSFSGDRLTLDRQGATLDTPDFHYSCLGFNVTDFSG